MDTFIIDETAAMCNIGTEQHSDSIYWQDVHSQRLAVRKEEGARTTSLLVGAKKVHAIGTHLSSTRRLPSAK